MFELATALGKTDQYDPAVALYDTLIDAGMTSAEILNNRGECLARLERTDAALDSFDRAIELDSDFAPALFGKARVLVNAERIDEAQPIVRQYLNITDDTERANPAVEALMQLCGIDG